MNHISELIHQLVNHSSSQNALVSNERTATYDDLARSIRNVEYALIKEGLRKGDRVLVLIQDPFEFIASMIAVIGAGGIAIPLNPASSDAVITSIASDSRSFGLFTSTNDLNAHPTLRDTLSCQFLYCDQKKLTVPSDQELMQFHTDKNDGALIAYTRSNDQSNQGIYFTHKNLLHGISIADIAGETKPSTSEYIMIPLHQIEAFNRILSILQSGGCAATPPEPQNPAVITKNIRINRCNTISLSSRDIPQFIEYIETQIKSQINRILYIHIIGDDISVAQKKRIMNIFQTANIFLQYGTSEAPCLSILPFHKERQKLNTVGCPTPMTNVAVCDDHGNPIDVESIGDIYACGEQIASSYWHNESLVPHLPISGGWFKTGQIGFIDTDGYIHVFGIQDEFINLRGSIISTSDIEEKIHDIYPDHDLCVIGVPDPSSTIGEIPVLCYVPHDGKTILLSELSVALSNQLEKDHIPRIIYRMNNFPRSENKIKRREIRNTLMHGMVQPIGQT